MFLQHHPKINSEEGDDRSLPVATDLCEKSFEILENDDLLAAMEPTPASLKSAVKTLFCGKWHRYQLHPVGTFRGQLKIVQSGKLLGDGQVSH
ncbi:hypothetical protein TYRP_001893 [Tyrophagus putrescentiae]|nr:hypothetical protein TYRP_001893 [Tyrophagus putrescentiae]